MNNKSFDLLGDEMRDPLGVNEHLTDVEQLVGHTIKAVINIPVGKMQADFILITETNCWMVFVAENSGCSEESAYIRTIRHGYGSQPLQISDFACADELRAAGFITESEYQYLKTKEDSQKADQIRKRASKLRDEADQLEKEIGAAHD